MMISMTVRARAVSDDVSTNHGAFAVIGAQPAGSYFISARNWIFAGYSVCNIKLHSHAAQPPQRKTPDLLVSTDSYGFRGPQPSTVPQEAYARAKWSTAHSYFYYETTLCVHMNSPTWGWKISHERMYLWRCHTELWNCEHQKHSELLHYIEVQSWWRWPWWMNISWRTLMDASAFAGAWWWKSALSVNDCCRADIWWNLKMKNWKPIEVPRLSHTVVYGIYIEKMNSIRYVDTVLRKWQCSRTPIIVFCALQDKPCLSCVMFPANEAVNR